MNPSSNVSIKKFTFHQLQQHVAIFRIFCTCCHTNACKSHPQPYFVTVLCLYRGTCNSSCPSGVNAGGSGCILWSGKDEADAHTVVSSDFNELHCLEEIMIFRLQLSSRFHNQQSHASHNSIQPKTNNNPSGNNSMNRWSQGHWCCSTNPQQSD